MLRISMGREEIDVAFFIAGYRVGTQVAVELAQFSHDVEIGVKDGQVTGATADIDVLGVGIHAGGLAQVTLGVEEQIAIGVKDMDGILLTVADPDMILGVYAQRVWNQEFTWSVNVVKKVVVPIAAPGLDEVTVFIKLMDSAVAITIRDVHVALAIVVDVGGIVERLAAGHGGALLIPLKRTAAAFLM